MMFYLIVLTSLGCAITLLTYDGATAISTNFAHFVQVWWTLIKVTVGFPDDFNLQGVPMGMEWTFDFLRTIFSIAVNILMLNLLIAMMSSTYSKYNKNSEQILMMEKYNILCSMDRSRAATHRLALCFNWLRERTHVDRQLRKYAVSENGIGERVWWYHKVEYLSI
jgi:hypothetical protein